MPRGPSGGYYQDGPPGMPRSRRMYRGGLSDIIMETGRARAGIQERMGADLAEGIGRVGEGIAGAVEERSRAEAMAKRDAAVVADLQNWNGDPKALLASMVKRLGPVDGPKMAQAVMSFQELGNQQDDREIQRLKDVGETAAKVPFPMFQTLWNTMRSKAPVFERYLGMQPGSLPEEATPELHEAVKSIFGPGPAAPVKLGANEILADPRTGKTLLENRPTREEKPDSRSIEARLAEAAASGDAETVNRLLSVAGRQAAATRAPQQAREPKPAEGGDENTAFLLQGGTAEKLPIGVRSAAVAAARASGGVDSTGFVPMNGPQQQKFSDFMDLRRKAIRLEELIEDPEVKEKLGPIVGRGVSMTKEMPLIGQSTKVKEAFDLFRDLSDTELRKRSGAAISPNEYERITGFTVDPTKQADSNATNLKRMLEGIEGGLKTIGATNLPQRKRGLPRVASDSDFDALPSGAEFIDPEGRRRRKP